MRSRPLLRGAALLAVAALVVTSCGSDDDTAENAGGERRQQLRRAPSRSPCAPPSATSVEEEPTRVVALGWGDAETALALGVQPVGRQRLAGLRRRGRRAVGRGPLRRGAGDHRHAGAQPTRRSRRCSPT